MANRGVGDFVRVMVFLSLSLFICVIWGLVEFVMNVPVLSVGIAIVIYDCSFSLVGQPNNEFIKFIIFWLVTEYTCLDLVESPALAMKLK